MNFIMLKMLLSGRHVERQHRPQRGVRFAIGRLDQRRNSGSQGKVLATTQSFVQVIFFRRFTRI